ncbi:streptococcal hemagglutinin-like isoform X2 [Dermacentor albipictus]|uniref:streptococcal hemagglutinin-like isoform X2 n=1 Tax=Dermacentor albipictus TaxID=60249 RepID=UPI0038FD262C
MAPSLRSTVKVPKRAVQLATSTSKQSSLKYKLLFKRSQQPSSEDLSSQRGVSQPSNLQHATHKVPRPTGDTSTRRGPKTIGSHLKNPGDNIDVPAQSGKKPKSQESPDRVPRQPMLKSDTEDSDDVDNPTHSKKTTLQKSRDRGPRKPMLKSDTEDSDDVDNPTHSKKTTLQKSRDRGPRKPMLKSDTEDSDNIDDPNHSKKTKLQKSHDRGPQKPILKSGAEDFDGVDDLAKSKKPKLQKSPDRVPRKPMLKSDTKDSDDIDDPNHSKKTKLQKSHDRGPRKLILKSDTEDFDGVDDLAKSKKPKLQKSRDRGPQKPVLESDTEDPDNVDDLTESKKPETETRSQESPDNVPCKPMLKIDAKGSDDADDLAQSKKAKLQKLRNTVQQKPMLMSDTEDSDDVDDPTYHKKLTSEEPHDQVLPRKPTLRSNARSNPGMQIRQPWKVDLKRASRLAGPLKEPQNTFLKYKDSLGEKAQASKIHEATFKPISSSSGITQQADKRVAARAGIQHIRRMTSIGPPKFRKPITKRKDSQYKCSVTGCPHTRDEGLVGFWLFPIPDKQDEPSLHSAWLQSMPVDFSINRPLSPRVCFKHFDQHKDFVLASKRLVGLKPNAVPSKMPRKCHHRQSMTSTDAAQELESANSIDTGCGSRSTTATDGVNELQSTTVVAMNHGSQSTTGTGKESEPMSIVGTAQESQAMTAAEAAQELESANFIDTGRGSRSTTATDRVNELQSTTVVAMNHGSRSTTGTGKESEPMSIVGAAQELQTMTAAEAAQELESANSIDTGCVSQSTTATDGGNEVQSTTVVAMNHGSQSTTGTGKESEPMSIVGTAQESQTMTAAEAAQELESTISIDMGHGSQTTTAADGGNELESVTVVAMNYGSQSMSGTEKESEPISIVGTAQESQTMTAAGTNSEPHCSNAITSAPELASDSNSRSAAELGPTFQASTELIGDNSGAGQQNKDNVCASVVSVNTGSLEEAAKYCPMVVTVSPLQTEDTNTGTCEPLPSGTQSEKCALESVSMQATNVWNELEQQKQDISCSLVTCGPVDDTGSSTTVSHCASQEGSHDSDVNADVCGLVKSVPKEMCSALTPPVLVTDNETADAMVGKLEIDLETPPQVSKDAIASSMSAQMCSTSKLVDTSSDQIDKEGMKVTTERHNLDPPHHIESSHRNDASITAFRTAAKVCHTLDVPAKPLFQKEVTVSNVAVLSHNLSNLVNSSNSEMNRNKQDNMCKRGLPEFSSQSYGYDVQRGDGLVSSHAFNVPVSKAAVDGKNCPKVSKGPSASCSANVRHPTDLPGGNSTEEAGKSKPTNSATASHLFDPSQGRYSLKKEVLQDGDELGSSAVLCTVVWVPTRGTNP